MRHFTVMEFWLLILAALFLCFGLAMLIHPTTAGWTHPAYNDAGGGSSYPEVITREGARLYGALGVLVGSGLAAFVLAAPRK
jgi:hypothetical protein